VNADTMIIAVAAFAGLVVLARTVLRGWNGWLELKRLELDRGPDRAGQGTGRGDNALGAGMIELSDLKERLRKLEAIAAGVDL